MCNCKSQPGYDPNGGNKTFVYNQSTKEIEKVVFNFSIVVPTTDMVADGIEISKHPTENRVIIILKTDTDSGTYKMDTGKVISYTHALTKSEWDALETDSETPFEINTDWCRYISTDGRGLPMFTGEGDEKEPVINTTPTEKQVLDCYWLLECTYDRYWPYTERCVWKLICIKWKSQLERWQDGDE